MTLGHPSNPGGDGSITVAPRELHDSLYRACRTSGAVHGEAIAISDAALFAVVHLDCTLNTQLDVLEGGRRPVFALPYVLRAISGERVETPATCVAADVAVFAVEALRRGNEIALFHTDRSEPLSMMALLDWEPEQPITHVAPTDGMSKAVVASAMSSIEARDSEGRRTGINLDLAIWHRLDGLAQRYLISESSIDDAIEKARAL